MVKEKNCLNCNEPLKKGNYKYCSLKCQKHREYKIYIENWKKGLEKGGTSVRTSHHVRRYLLETHGHTCTICHTSTWCNGIIPLILDHINGNSDDHSEANLRMICPNCDAQLSTYTGRNRGKGRYTRRERYKKFKFC